jgi:DNA-binding XRE family transcriptional regulator
VHQKNTDTGVYMPRLATGSHVQRLALNEWLLHAGRAPKRPALEPPALIRTLRARLRMSQAELARRSGLTQSHVARIETGALDPQWSTLRRLLGALFCGAALLPLPRKRPSDALAEARVDGDPRLPWPPQPRDISKY